jgi:hypothetical protein
VRTHGASDHVLPVASALLGGFLAYHLVLGHHEPAATAPMAPAVDTARLRALTMPVTTNAVIPDADPNDGVTASYDGVFTLREDGLRYSGALSYGYVHRVALDSSFVGLATVSAITLAIAEPAPWGWRIAKAGTPITVGPSPSVGVKHFSFGRAGNELPRPSDTLKIEGATPLDLVDRWPVVIHDLVLADPETEERTRIQVFAHGSRSAFRALLAPKPWEQAP